MDTMKEAFEDLIRDCYNAEKQITKALPKVIKKCSDDSLRQALESHLQETEEHVQKCAQIAEMNGFRPTGKVCHGMMGILEEGDEALKEIKQGPVRDAAVIMACQKVEHYEMVNYATAKAWCKELGLKQCIPIIESILEQEGQADKKLNGIALVTVNDRATEMSASKDGKISGAKTEHKVSVR